MRPAAGKSGGARGEVFAFELTAAEVVCGGRGALAPVGAVLVYAHDMGTIVRCAGRDTALIGVATSRGRVWLDPRGARSIAIGVQLQGGRSALATGR